MFFTLMYNTCDFDSSAHNYFTKCYSHTRFMYQVTLLSMPAAVCGDTNSDDDLYVIVNLLPLLLLLLLLFVTMCGDEHIDDDDDAVVVYCC